MSESARVRSGFINGLIHTGTVVSGLALISMVALILSEIIMRAIFSSSMYVLDELVGYCMVTMTFAGLGFALKEEKLIRVGIVLSLLKKNVLALQTLELTNFVAAATVLSFFEFHLIMSTLRDFRRGTHSGTMLETPTWLPQSIVAIMILLFLLLLLAKIIALLTGGARNMGGAKAL